MVAQDRTGHRDPVSGGRCCMEAATLAWRGTPSRWHGVACLNAGMAWHAMSHEPQAMGMVHRGMTSIAWLRGGKRQAHGGADGEWCKSAGRGAAWVVRSLLRGLVGERATPLQLPVQPRSTAADAAHGCLLLLERPASRCPCTPPRPRHAQGCQLPTQRCTVKPAGVAGAAQVRGCLYNSTFHVVVSADEGGTVCVWDISSGQREGRFKKAHGDVRVGGLLFRGTGPAGLHRP